MVFQPESIPHESNIPFQTLHGTRKVGRSKWETGKTQYVRGALWDSDIGSVFRSSLYRFTVFGASTAGSLQDKSHVRTGWSCEHLCTKRRWGGLEKTLEKGNNFTINKNINETMFCSRYCKVSVLVVYHIAFHSLEPLSTRLPVSQINLTRCSIN